MINSSNVVEAIDTASGSIAVLSSREALLALEEEIKAMPQVDIPAAHLFSGNIYARGILIPAGTVLTGRMYLDDHIDLMVYGDMTVTSDDGQKRISGFNLIEGKSGKKRAGYAHTDTFWITFCKCDEMTEDYYMNSLTTEGCDEVEQLLIRRRIVDSSVIEVAFTGGDYESFESGYLAASGMITKIQADLEDFELMARETGFSVDTIRSESEIDIDLSDLAVDGVFVAPSNIQGNGLFTDQCYTENQDIMLARVGGMRTIAGRYANHSIEPNAEFYLLGDDLMLRATQAIDGDEITVDYRNSIQFRGESCQA